MKQLKPITLLILVSALTACSGSGAGRSGSEAGASSGDRFVRSTQQLTGNTADDSEPADIEALPVTMPEDAEPVDVG